MTVVEFEEWVQKQLGNIVRPIHYEPWKNWWKLPEKDREEIMRIVMEIHDANATTHR